VTALERLDVHLGVHRHAHLAARGEDVDGAVVVGGEEGAVRGRRHRELLDLLAQRGDVLARLAQGRRQALVLRDGLGHLALGLEKSLFERAHALRSVLEAAPQDDDLLLERLELRLQVVDLALVLLEAHLVLGSHGDTSLSGFGPSGLGPLGWALWVGPRWLGRSGSGAWARALGLSGLASRLTVAARAQGARMRPLENLG
jgi:hypothetical protein